MTRTPGNSVISAEWLNAYVDGALTTEEAAQIAQAAATRPEIATRIAMLHHLKAAVAGIGDDAVVPAPPLPAALVPPGRRLRQHVAIAAAAALAAAAVVALVPIFAAGPAAPVVSAPDDRLARYTTAHDTWLAAGGAAVGTPRITDWLDGLMQETGLSLLHETAFPLEDGDVALHFAFVGPNGCRLSLFNAAASGEGSAGLDIAISGRLLTARWVKAERSFALVARDMDRTRFASIAAAIHDASEGAGSVDAQVLANLRQSRQPCIG